MTQTPSLATAFAEALEARLMDLHVSTPGVVTAYNATSGRVSVQPLVMRAYLDEKGERQVEKAPIIADVPVLFPGSGGDGMTFPIKNGDYVVLLFSENSIGTLLRYGGIVDPETDRKHSFSDAYALCGFRINGVPNTPTDAVVIRCSTELRLGGYDANDPVVRKSDLQAHIDQYKTHTHPVPSGPGTSSVTTQVVADANGSPVVKSK